MEHKFWATGMRGGYVKVRRGPKKPKYVITQVVAKGKARKWAPTGEIYPWGEAMWDYCLAPTEMNIKIGEWLGGRVIGTFSRKDFVTLTKIQIHEGGCIELGKEVWEGMKTWVSAKETGATRATRT